MDNITLIRDCSNVTRGIEHYFANFIWIGWTFFYFILPGLTVFLYYYSITSLTIIYGLMLISAFAPSEYRKQPEVSRLNLVLYSCGGLTFRWK